MSTQRTIGRSARGGSTEAGEARRGAADDARKYAIRDRSTGTPPATVDPLYAIVTGVIFPVHGAIMLSRLRVGHTGTFDRARSYVGGAAAGTVPVGLAIYEVSQEISAPAGDPLVAIGSDKCSMDLDLMRGTVGWSTVDAVGKTCAEVIFRQPVIMDPDRAYAMAISVVGAVDGAAMGTYPGTIGQSPRLKTVLAAGDAFPTAIRIRDNDMVANVDPWTVMSVLLSRTHLPGFVMP